MIPRLRLLPAAAFHRRDGEFAPSFRYLSACSSIRCMQPTAGKALRQATCSIRFALPYTVIVDFTLWIGGICSQRFPVVALSCLGILFSSVGLAHWLSRLMPNIVEIPCHIFCSVWCANATAQFAYTRTIPLTGSDFHRGIALALLFTGAELALIPDSAALAVDD